MLRLQVRKPHNYTPKIEIILSEGETRETLCSFTGTYEYTQVIESKNNVKISFYYKAWIKQESPEFTHYYHIPKHYIFWFKRPNDTYSVLVNTFKSFSRGEPRPDFISEKLTTQIIERTLNNHL